MIAVLHSKAVFGSLTPVEAIEAVRAAFIHHARGEWEMPAKVYVDAPPAGDFRAMPARGGGYAILKWVTSFPGNPSRGLPVVAGALLVSSAETGELLAILDCGSVTALRTGAAAALSADVLARPGAESVGVVGCGVNGSWAARCLAALGYRDGICADLDPAASGALASELRWRTGSVTDAVGCDVVVTVTPGGSPVVEADALAQGAHVALLGADAHGKAEATAEAIARCRLFCDEWAQASAGGELAGPVSRGEVVRRDVTEIGDVLLDREPGRRAADEITAFDSTGLAIQDLGIAVAVLAAWRAGRVEAADVSL